jgi:hypothetical protein
MAFFLVRFSPGFLPGSEFFGEHVFFSDFLGKEICGLTPLEQDVLECMYFTDF